MNRYVSRSIVAFLLAALASLPTLASVQQVGDWSEPVNGLRGRLSVREDKPFIGTRMLAAYLELENVSDVGDPIAFYFDPARSIVSRVVDQSGAELTQPPNGASVALPAPFWLSVPWDGSLRFRISVSGYGVYKNSGTQIQMNSGSWLIRAGDMKKYFLEASLVTNPPAGDRRRAWTGKLTFPKVEIPH